MKLIIYNLKRLYAVLIRKILSFICLNSLNQKESLGFFSKRTRLKFLKKNILNLPYANGLTIRGTSFNSSRSQSPDGFIKALSLSNNDICKEHFYEILTSIFAEEKNKTIGHYNNGIFNPNLKSQPIHAFAYPWESKPISQKVIDYNRDIIENRSNYSSNLSSNIYDISHIDSHFFQFSKLYASIAKHGFLLSNTPPKVYILKNNNKWKWIMSGDGNHRAYCNHLTGSKYLNACIEGVIDINNIHKISCKNGHEYSRNEVEDLFEILWSGKFCVRGIV